MTCIACHTSVAGGLTLVLRDDHGRLLAGGPAHPACALARWRVGDALELAVTPSHAAGRFVRRPRVLA